MSLSSWDEDEKEDALDSARGVIYDFYHFLREDSNFYKLEMNRF